MSRVLFAVAGSRRPRNSLQRAWRMARALGAELHVLRVLRRRQPTAFRDTRSVYDAATLRRFLEACRQLQAWCAEVITDAPLPPEQWQVRTGSFFEEVVNHALAIDASCVVLAPERERMGGLVTSLARELGRPVLLSRGPIADGRAVVAATDLASTRFPVLDQAASLAQRFDQPMIAVHNVAPRQRLDVSWRRGLVGPLKTEQLERVASQLQVEVKPVVVRAPDAVDAILEQARGNDASVILVGTRPHSWLRRWTNGSVSARVVDEARRSVLVVPL